MLTHLDAAGRDAETRSQEPRLGVRASPGGTGPMAALRKEDRPGRGRSYSTVPVVQSGVFPG